jgi:hypothetical protein
MKKGILRELLRLGPWFPLKRGVLRLLTRAEILMDCLGRHVKQGFFPSCSAWVKVLAEQGLGYRPGECCRNQRQHGHRPLLAPGRRLHGLESFPFDLSVGWNLFLKEVEASLATFINSLRPGWVLECDDNNEHKTQISGFRHRNSEIVARK